VDRLFGWFDQHNINLTALLATAVIVIAAFALSRVIRRILPNSLRGVAARLDFPYEIALTAARVLTGVMWVIVAMLLLEMWGISVGGLWTLLVSATTVIGVGFLATWTMVSNITASFFIAIWRPFRLGAVRPSRTSAAKTNTVVGANARIMAAAQRRRQSHLIN
jgi:hypothetical protein